MIRYSFVRHWRKHGSVMGQIIILKRLKIPITNLGEISGI
jgi:hypothetical protein